MCGSLRHQRGEGTSDGVEGDTLDTVCICTSPNWIKLGKTTIVEFSRRGKLYSIGGFQPINIGVFETHRFK